MRLTRIIDSQTATLEDDEPEAFENICQWLYNKACELPPTNIGEGYSPFLWSVAKSYAAAEKYGMVALKNYLIDRFFVFGASLKSLRSPAPTIVQYVYRQTPTKSPLRRLFVAFYVWKSNPGWYEHDYTRRLMRTIPDFAIDLACTMGTVIHDFPANNPFEGSSHIYHEVMSPTEHGQDNDQSIL